MCMTEVYNYGLYESRFTFLSCELKYIKFRDDGVAVVDEGQAIVGERKPLIETRPRRGGVRVRVVM